MATSDFPQGHLTGHSNEDSGSNARLPDRSRVEETLISGARLSHTTAMLVWRDY